MILYPAIDLIAGRCVRLHQGDFAAVTRYETSPVDVARTYAQAGATRLHVVDLDGARDGASRQTELIRLLCAASGLAVQAGGGVRDVAGARALVAAGVERIVVGSLAVTRPDAAREVIDAVGPERVTLAVDVRIQPDGAAEVAIHGWQAGGGARLDDVVSRYRELGVRHVLCTDISRDGTLQGPNVPLYAGMAARYPDVEIQASGGIGSLDDIRALKQAGVPAAILGKALYERKFALEEALAC